MHVHTAYHTWTTHNAIPGTHTHTCVVLLEYTHQCMCTQPTIPGLHTMIYLDQTHTVLLERTHQCMCTQPTISGLHTMIYLDHTHTCVVLLEHTHQCMCTQPTIPGLHTMIYLDHTHTCIVLLEHTHHCCVQNECTYACEASPSLAYHRCVDVLSYGCGEHSVHYTNTPTNAVYILSTHVLADVHTWLPVMTLTLHR